MKRVLLRSSVAFALLAGVLLPVQVRMPARAVAATTIQPGDSMTSVGKGCTIGFAATAGDNTYFLTAAHCVDDIDNDVALDDGTVFADIVARGNPDITEDDWALMLVRPQYVSLVRGNVRGVPGDLTGVADSDETVTGDHLRFSGHGVPWFIDPITRENRYGAVVYDDPELYTAVGMDLQGDSGGPILLQQSRKAYGLVSRLCIGICTSEGPTIEGVFEKAAAAGFSLMLKTN